MKDVTYQISVKELPTFYSGMCYVIRFENNFNNEDSLSEMTVTIEKKVTQLQFVKVWITSDYDYLDAIHHMWGDIIPYKFSVPFGGVHTTQVTVVETMLKPLTCLSSDTCYVSQQQCLVNKFLSKDFTPCPFKCLPIQMKGFRYINDSLNLDNCSTLEDETCNGGPKVWSKLEKMYLKCLKPCIFTTYIHSRLELVELMYMKTADTQARFELMIEAVRKAETERLLYDTNDMIGAVGGSLGLFLGFSFFDTISKCIDTLIYLFNYLSSTL